MSNITSADLLAELNAFRAADGLAPLADWRRPRHMPMLEAYRANVVTDAEAEEVHGYVLTGLGTEPPNDPSDTLDPDEQALEAEALKIAHEELAKEEAADEFPPLENHAPLDPLPSENDAPAPVAEKAKAPTYKEIANYTRSTVIKPLERIHSFLDANPHLTRKAAVQELVGQGINFSTARTQYQRWFTKRKA